VDKMTSGLKLGIKKIGHIKGNLNNYRLLDILTGIKKTGKTGILQINTGLSTKKIYFKKGAIVFSSSDEEDDRIAKMLLNQGKINPYQYKKTLDLIEETGRPQGAALVELGYLRPRELPGAVRYQAEKIVVNILGLEQGSFIFNNDPIPPEELITLNLDDSNLIYQGIKSIDNIGKIRNNCPPPDSTLFFSSNNSDRLREIRPDKNDERILSIIDGNRTLGDIISVSPLDEAETLKIICSLYNTRIIDVVAGTRPKAPSDTGKATAQPKPELDPAVADKIGKMYQQYKSLGYYGILNISRDATLNEIKCAYHKMAKEFHPDRYLHFQSDSLKKKLNAIFAYITEAYKVLSNPDSRRQQPAEPGPTIHDTKKTARMQFNKGKEFLDADFFFNKDNYELALRFFGKAVVLDSSVPEYHYFYGIALLKSGKTKEAELSMKKALKLDPGNADYMAELGYLYLELDFKARAKSTFQRALEIDPQNIKASEGLKKIK
ncbi:MAG: DUF4388 domain-containing protein, partial [Nitrospirota bacterium]|nr:DUF4388 domain-containing protein [Nitrospirota bacterium]